MKQLNLYEENDFSEKAFKKLLVHDSPYFKILNFNFKAGQELPVHEGADWEQVSKEGVGILLKGFEQR